MRPLPHIHLNQKRLLWSIGVWCLFIHYRPVHPGGRLLLGSSLWATVVVDRSIYIYTIIPRCKVAISREGCVLSWCRSLHGMLCVIHVETPISTKNAVGSTFHTLKFHTNHITRQLRSWEHGKVYCDPRRPFHNVHTEPPSSLPP